MNKLIFLFLSLLSFALHALMGDHKAFVDVKAQTVVIDEPRGLSTYSIKFKRQNYTDSHSFDGIIFFMSAL
jgi:hypothetical protein